MNRKDRQELFDFSSTKPLPIGNLTNRDWVRVSVVTGRCTGECSSCDCIPHLKSIAKMASMRAISFNGRGTPIFTVNELRILCAKAEKIVPDESLDREDVIIQIPPASLAPCSDDDL